MPNVKTGPLLAYISVLSILLAFSSLLSFFCIFRKFFGVTYSSALQPVCTVHQNMRGVHRYERVHQRTSQTCHTKQILFTKTLLAKINHQPMNDFQDLT